MSSEHESAERMSSQTKWLIGIALALAGLILQQSTALRGDIRATNARIDVLTETVAQVREIQAQHSVKLDQLLAAEPTVDPEVLAQSVTEFK